MIRPRPRPDYWKAQGSDTTAVPIIVFHTEKMMIIELWVPFLSTGSYEFRGCSSSNPSANNNPHINYSIGKLTSSFSRERILKNKLICLNQMHWGLKKLRSAIRLIFLFRRQMFKACLQGRVILEAIVLGRCHRW